MNGLVLGLLLLLVGAVAFGLALLLRRAAPGVTRMDTGPASSTLSYVAAAYGVLVGFSIVFLLGQVASARSAIGDEATSIGTAFDEAQLFPESEPDLQRALICYSRAVVEREWSDLADGRSAPEADAAYRELIAAYGAADEPLDATFQPAAATNSFVQLGSISTARETRIVAAQVHIGPLMWTLLLGGGVLVVGLVFLLTASAGARGHATFVALAAMFTAVMLLLVVVLSHPFRDATAALSPRPIAENLERMTSIAGSTDQPCPFEAEP